MFRESSERVANKVGVVGLGYVGLPLAVAFAESGLSVTGVDTNVKKVAAINSGASYIEDVASEDLVRPAKSGWVRATEDYSELSEADAVFLCILTPLDEHRAPDLSHVTEAAGKWRGISRAALSSSSKARLIRGRRGKFCSRCSRGADGRSGRISSSTTRASR